MENNQENQQSLLDSKKKISFNYNKYYKLLLLVPIILLIFSLVYLGIFYSKNGDIMYKDVSLAGGTAITLQGQIDQSLLEEPLKQKFQEVSFTQLTDITTGENLALIIESSSNPEELQDEIEKILGYDLTGENSSIEFTGASLSKNFYNQLILALLISFLLMSLVVFVMFRTFIPSVAVIFAIFSNIVIPLTVINLFEIRLSAAGIAAFLMLIGYSVDTDILLTSRVLKSREDNVNTRIFRAFKTGSLMNLTALAAVLPAFFIVTGLPDSFRQIFLILAIGVCADWINTWFTNAGIIKWYTVKKGIN